MKILQVVSKKEKGDFLKLPWTIYKGMSNWVPPLLVQVEGTLDTQKNPFWKHAKLAMWNAYGNGRCIGRIAGVIDEAHNNFHDEKTGFWGFFECINDQEVASALFREVEVWARSHGMKTLRGPVNPSTNHECGLQVSAFETRPYVMMTQNPDYYPALVEKAGFAKTKDLLAWHITGQARFDDKLINKVKSVVKDEGITFRHIDMKRYDEEVEKLLEVYNEAWEKNWGFVPMNPEEFRHMAKEMKAVIVPQLIFIAEVKGEVAAFSLFLPDINQILHKIRDGRLFPTGLLKLLWYTKVKRSIFRGRVLTLGVKKKFRSLGLGSMLYFRYIKGGPMAGFNEAECSWILEDNEAMNEGLRLMNARLYKTYRIYDKPLN